MIKKVLLVFALAGLFLTSLTFGEKAEVQESFTQQEAPVTAHISSSVDRIKAGEPFYIGIELKMSQGWDTYWKNPGDLGMPTQVKWDLPEGFEAGELLWPSPERYISEGVIGYRYRDHVMLLTKVKPPKELKGQEFNIKAQVSWLACGQQCLPGEASLNLSLPAGEVIRMDSAVLQAIERLPKSFEKEDHFVISQEKQDLILKVDSVGAPIIEASFIPEYNDVIDPTNQKWEQKGDQVSLRLKLLSEGKATKITGILALVNDQGENFSYEIDHGVLKENTTNHTVSYFAVALLCAFLGGVILNAMPCVLPVLGLKIMSFVKMAQEKRSLLIQQGVSFTAGVVASFWALASLLLVLRAYGQNVGWGFQLQEPLFVGAMALVLFLLGLSLFGVFEVGTSLTSLGQSSKKRSPLMASFLSGILATIVATPCTGPLLGPALGLALTLSGFQSWMIFTTIALGMASPYLLLSIFPKLMKWIPKPGPWMLKLKWAMGILMMCSFLWLGWVFFAQTSTLSFVILLSVALVLGVAGWIYGKGTFPLSSKKKRRYSMYGSLSLALLALFGGYLGYNQTKHLEQQAIVQGGDFWENFAPEQIEAYRKEGKAVFVDFTAKWCLICQANKVTLYSTEVQQAFKDKNVVTMTADWTKKDPVITQALEQMGRSGVPLYVIFPAEPGSKPIVLPQTLTVKSVKEALAKLDESD